MVYVVWYVCMVYVVWCIWYVCMVCVLWCSMYGICSMVWCVWCYMPMLPMYHMPYVVCIYPYRYSTLHSRVYTILQYRCTDKRKWPRSLAESVSRNVAKDSAEE